MAFLCLMPVIVMEMLSDPDMSGTIFHTTNMAVTIIVNLICVFGAFLEMKIHKFCFKDISPVNQNGKVFIFAAVFAVGYAFAFQFITSLFWSSSALRLANEVTSGSEVLTFFAYLSASFVLEVFFMGIMVKTFEKRFSIWFGVVSVTVFSVLTMLIEDDDYKYFGILLLAAVIFLRYKFGDLKLCVLVHAIATVLFVAVSLLRLDGSIMIITGIIGALIAAAAMFFMLKFSSDTQPAQSESE